MAASDADQRDKARRQRGNNSERLGIGASVVSIPILVC